MFACNFEFKKDKYKHPELEVEADIKPHKTKPNNWIVSVRVKTPEDMDKETFPFTFLIGAVGRIQAAPITENDDALKAKRILYVNAASILYSSLRDRLSQFASHPAFGSYFLPSWRFDPEDIKK